MLAACAPGETAIPQGSAARGDPAKPVAAVAETVVTTDPAVDADDPVLWADRGDPSRALWIGTDKSDGLYGHSLDGTVRQFFPDGPLNNVDLREGFVVDGKPYVLIAAAERIGQIRRADCRALVEQRYTLAHYGAALADWLRALATESTESTTWPLNHS